MDSESQRVYDRMKLYELIQTDASTTDKYLAEAIGRSERWVRKWRRRFATVDEPGFAMFQSQSHAPKTRSNQTPESVKDVICRLRETLSETYHRTAGADLIK